MLLHVLEEGRVVGGQLLDEHGHGGWVLPEPFLQLLHACLQVLGEGVGARGGGKGKTVEQIFHCSFRVVKGCPESKLTLFLREAHLNEFLEVGVRGGGGLGGNLLRFGRTCRSYGGINLLPGLWFLRERMVTVRRVITTSVSFSLSRRLSMERSSVVVFPRQTILRAAGAQPRRGASRAFTSPICIGERVPFPRAPFLGSAPLHSDS